MSPEISFGISPRVGGLKSQLYDENSNVVRSLEDSAGKILVLVTSSVEQS